MQGGQWGHCPLQGVHGWEQVVKGEKEGIEMEFRGRDGDGREDGGI